MTDDENLLLIAQLIMEMKSINNKVNILHKKIHLCNIQKKKYRKKSKLLTDLLLLKITGNFSFILKLSFILFSPTCLQVLDFRSLLPTCTEKNCLGTAGAVYGVPCANIRQIKSYAILGIPYPFSVPIGLWFDI